MFISEKFISTTIDDFLNENIINDNDYSGEYHDLYNFIKDNNLQELFVNKYSKYDKNLTIDNWDEYVYGEFDCDESVIENLIGKKYKIYYDDKSDNFIITKKKTGKLNYKIIYSDDNKINDVIDDAGIYSEYKPRFAVVLNNKIIGGSTYQVQDNIYKFDIGILDEYQGYGMAVKLINCIISDAKKMNVEGISALVVNNILFDYLINNGFRGTNENGIKYVYKQL